jgi:hypothetical protein
MFLQYVTITIKEQLEENSGAFVQHLTYITTVIYVEKHRVTGYLLLQLAPQPLVGFRPTQLSLTILSRKVLQSAVASGTSNPQIGGEPGI